MTYFIDKIIWVFWLGFIVIRALKDSKRYYDWQQDIELSNYTKATHMRPLYSDYIKHGRNAWLALGVAAVLYIVVHFGYILSWEINWMQILFYTIGCFGLYWGLFDILFNIFTDQPPFKIGTTAWTDKLQQKLPIVEAWEFLKAFLSVMGIYMYYHTDLL